MINSNSTPPDSLPSLELMKSANILLTKATDTDRQKLFDLMESYDKTTSEDDKWEILGIMFVNLIFDPNVDADDVYAQLKKLLMAVNTKP